METPLLMIYLDNAATSYPKPPEVAAAMTEHLEKIANPGRGSHHRAVAVERMIERARLTLARLLHADDPKRIIFTASGTDALNLAIFGVVTACESSGEKSSPPHVVTTVLEHNSVNRPLNFLQGAGRVELSRVRCDDEGVLAAPSIAAEIRDETVLVAVTAVSNAIGTIQPLRDIVEAVRAENPEALILVDAAQAVGALEFDIGSLDVDLVAFPGHKGLLGPTGTGVLYAGPRAVGSTVRMLPYRMGGTGGDSASPLMPDEMPHYLEGGTPNTVGIAGLLAGVEWLMHRGVDDVRKHERKLAERLLGGLSALPGVHVLGPGDPQRRVGLVSFLIDGFETQDAATVLDDSFQIAVRAGLHCAPNAHRALGSFPAGAVRASVGPFSQGEEIDRLIDAVMEITRNR